MARSRINSSAGPSHQQPQAAQAKAPPAIQPPRPTPTSRSTAPQPTETESRGTQRAPTSTQQVPTGTAKGGNEPTQRDLTPPRTPPAMPLANGHGAAHRSPPPQHSKHHPSEADASGVQGQALSSKSIGHSAGDAVTPPPTANHASMNGATRPGEDHARSIPSRAHSNGAHAAGDAVTPSLSSRQNGAGSQGGGYSRTPHPKTHSNGLAPPQPAVSDGVVHSRTPHPAAKPHSRHQSVSSRAAPPETGSAGPAHSLQQTQGGLAGRGQAMSHAQQSGRGPAGSPQTKPLLQQQGGDGGRAVMGIRPGPLGQTSPRRKRSQELITDENESSLKVHSQGPLSPGRTVSHIWIHYCKLCI